MAVQLLILFLHGPLQQSSNVTQDGLVQLLDSGYGCYIKITELLASFPVSTPSFFSHVVKKAEKKLGVETGNEATELLGFTGIQHVA